MPGARCTRGPCAKVESNAHAVTTGTPDIRHSLRDGFNGLFRALPGDEFLLSPSSVDLRVVETRLGSTYLRSLTQQRVPGPHGFAVRSDHPHRLTRPCAAA